MWIDWLWDQNSASLPLVRAPPDALRFGFYSASEDVKPLHEVQRLQTTVRGFGYFVARISCHTNRIIECSTAS